jgi:transcriptional regulator with GAF, ATPase, and Fis domain
MDSPHPTRSRGRSLEVCLPTPEPAEPGRPQRAEADGNLQALERQHILTDLRKTGWRITSKGGAAERLGLKCTTLHSQRMKLGIPSAK